MKRETIAAALEELDERFICESAEYGPNSMQGLPERKTPMKTKRILTIALAAALILALGVTAYAVAGRLRSTAKTPLPKTAEYSDLADLPEIEKNVGYPIHVPETFTNGYSFAALRTEGEAVFGENDEILKEFYGVRITYSLAGAPDLYLELSPTLDLPGGAAAPEPGQRRTIRGVTVDLSVDHYKLVPEGYEKTAEDLAKEAEGHYYITFGPDTIMECEYAFASFELNGVNYVLTDLEASADSPDVLAEMAGEVIAAANS